MTDALRKKLTALIISKKLFFLALTAIFILAIVPNESYLGEMFSKKDMVNHFLAFVVLSFLIDHAYRSSPVPGKILFLAAYGFTIEAVQYFLPYRQFSLTDFVIDLASTLLYFGLIGGLSARTRP